MPRKRVHLQCRHYLGRGHERARANGCCMAKVTVTGYGGEPPKCPNCASTLHWVDNSQDQLGWRRQQTCRCSGYLHPHSRYSPRCVNNPHPERYALEEMHQALGVMRTTVNQAEAPF